MVKLTIKYHEVDWWFWAVITLGLVLGLVGVGWGITLALAVSVVNLVYFMLKAGSLTELGVQVRAVWLGLVLIAAWVPGLGWLVYLLVLGMLMVLLFDRCTIARVLVMMPWNKGVILK